MRGRVALRVLGWLFLAIIAFPLAWAGQSVQVDVISDDGYASVLRLRLLDYRTRTIEIGGEAFSELNIPGEAIALERGAPGLPHVTRDLIVPDDAAMDVRVLASTFHEMPGLVAPSRGALPRTVDPSVVPYEFGAEYGIDAFYPAATATLSDPYILRDYRGVALRWNPFQYNPVRKTLRVYDEVTLEVRPVGPSATNVLHREAMANRPVRSFNDLYRDHFANYAERQGFAAYPPIDESGEMLVICHDAWTVNMDPLVAHKNERGIPTTVVPVSTIGNDPVSIKSYIQNYYNTHNLAFVLLVGDSAQVATPLLNNYDASDPSYSKLAGNDDYPEILVGRMSAQNAAQVDTQVQRTIGYETMPATTQDWYRRGVGIASDQGLGAGDEGQSDRMHQDEIRGWLLGAGWTSVDQIYDPGATAQMVANAVNAGRGIINYTGHGSATSWGTTGFNTNDVANLMNKDQLPFIVSVACNNGEFNHYDPCFAEAWLRASKDGRPTGAVAVYMSSISQSWASPMEGQDEFNLRLTDPAKPYSSFGALCFAGGSSMMSAYGGDGINMFNTWHVFGDPSVRVSPGQASGLSVTPYEGMTSEGHVGGPFSPSSKTYTLKNLNSSPLDYDATAAEPWIEVTNSRGALAAGETATVTVSLGDRAAGLDLGQQSGTVRFVNLTDHDGDTTRGVSVRAKGTLKVHGASFDGDPGWTRQGEWAFGQPTGGGGGGHSGFNPDPTSGFTGTNVFGVNLLGDFASNKPAGPFYVIFGPIDLRGVRGATLKFQRWLNTGGPPTIRSTIDVSRDDVSWSSVWSSGGSIAESQWTQQSLDISSVADGQATVYVRWGYQVVTKVPGGAGSGWNIDDVEIWGEPGSAKTMLTVERDHLDWTSIPGAPFYDVVGGNLVSLRDTSGDFTAATAVCLADSTAATTLANSDVPSIDDGLWYLVRGAGYSGTLTYQDVDLSQAGSRDAEIDVSGGACP